MPTIEESLKNHARELRGDIVVGIAGRERLNGPPSADPGYILPGARSIISFALPMNVPAIYEFLSKKSPVPHNADQVQGNQAVLRIAKQLSKWLRARGFRAKAVEANSNYRKRLDPLALTPTFSHRYAALAAGVGGQGWSGNVVTKEYGGAVYLGTVVTDARLESDPQLGPREMFEEWCKTCKICEKSCPVGMFEPEREESYLLGEKCYPRGRRRNVDLCTASCFGMHALSRDKKWTSWGEQWIDDWMEGVPEPENKLAVRAAFFKQAARAGDSGRRATLIRRTSYRELPPEAQKAAVPAEELPKDENLRDTVQREFARAAGVPTLNNPNVLTCGHCSLICGPTLKERGKRYRMLLEGGYVVPGPGGKMVQTQSFEEAQAIRKANRRRVSLKERREDTAVLNRYSRHNIGFEPLSELKGLAYRLRMKQALAKEE